MNEPSISRTLDTTRSSGQDILLPPKSKDRSLRTIYLEINSRDRNIVSYPNSSEFRWKFQRPLKDIVSFQVVGGTIPTRIYNIDSGWNQFTFQEGTVKYQVTLSPGRYTLSLFGIELASKLNSLSGISNVYSCSISPTSDQLTITRDFGTESFSLLFASGSYTDLFDQNNTLVTINTPRILMGFLNKDYSDSTTGKITSPNAMDLEFLFNRIYLYMNYDNSQGMATIERSNGKQNPYTIIYMDSNEQTYKTFTKEVFQPTYFSQPLIARMSVLDISLRDAFYRLINLNNRDFTLLLEVRYYE
jgi:hypothetical protein